MTATRPQAPLSDQQNHPQILLMRCRLSLRDAAVSAFRIDKLGQHASKILPGGRHAELNSPSLHLLVELLNIGDLESQFGCSRRVPLRRWM
jgi:hypothetical protein